MSTVMSLVTSFIGKQVGEGMGVSKTKVAGHAMGLNGLFVLLPPALTGDPTAIGQLVAFIVTWALVLWGRGNK